MLPGSPAVESAWTLVKLSPTLCWLEAHRTLHDVAVAAGPKGCHTHTAMQSASSSVVIVSQNAFFRCYASAVLQTGFKG